MIDGVLIAATAGSRVEAEMIARALVERRLAACVQMSAITSVYRWNEAVEHAEEVLLLIKTTAAQAEAAEAAIARLHSYGTPEILRLAIVGGSADYLAWLSAAVGQPERKVPPG